MNMLMTDGLCIMSEFVQKMPAKVNMLIFAGVPDPIGRDTTTFG